MKTSVIEVHDMLSILSVEEVEKGIAEVPGVESVTVNYAAKSATARYNETRLDIADIKSGVRQRGYEAADHPAATGDAHAGHTGMDAPPASPPPTASATAPVGDATVAKASPDKAMPPMSPTDAPKPAEAAAAVHEEPDDKAAPDKK